MSDTWLSGRRDFSMEQQSVALGQSMSDVFRAPKRSEGLEPSDLREIGVAY